MAAVDEWGFPPHLLPMIRSTVVLIRRPPPLWSTQLVHCRTLMRDLGAPAILIEGQVVDTPFGPHLAATLDVPPEMGPVSLTGHPSYRRVMHDAAGMVNYARMMALAASGVTPVTASREPESVLWQLVVVPAGVVLITRTATADYGPFLLCESAPDERLTTLASHQLSFAGITVGCPPPESPPGLNSA